jgi:hypothetical protein
MKIEKREELTDVLVSRVISNAPIRELVRVYGEAVTAAVNELSVEDLAKSVVDAGYRDLLDLYITDLDLDPEGVEGVEGAVAAGGPLPVDA